MFNNVEECHAIESDFPPGRVIEEMDSFQMLFAAEGYGFGRVIDSPCLPERTQHAGHDARSASEFSDPLVPGGQESRENIFKDDPARDKPPMGGLNPGKETIDSLFHILVYCEARGEVSEWISGRAGMRDGSNRVIGFSRLASLEIRKRVRSVRGMSLGRTVVLPAVLG
jgi:hypothetical protein